MFNANRKLKRLVVLLVLVVLLIFVGTWLYGYLTSATLTVSSVSAADFVSITPVNNGVLNSAGSVTAQHEITQRLKFGSYLISVFNHSNHLNRFIELNSHSQKSYVLRLSLAVTPEPVYGAGVIDLSASGSQLSFIGSSNHIDTVSASNAVGTIDQSQNFVSASWANPTLGVVEDSRGNLYLVKGGALSQIVLPFPANTLESYAMTSMGSIYLSSGYNLYYSPSGGVFKQVYSSSNPILQLAAGNNQAVLVVGERQNNPDSSGNIVLVDANGSVKNIDQRASALKVSPDGSELAAATNSYLSIYSLSGNTSSETVMIPVGKSLNSFAWGKDNRLYFVQGGTLWEYDSSSSEYYQITQTPAQMEITAVYPDTEDDYVYITLDNSGQPTSSVTQSELYRVPLKGQAVSADFSSIGLIFPAMLQGFCSVNYVNFTSPTLRVSYPSSVNQQFCSTAISTELKQYGIETSQLGYDYVPQAIN